jgi:predicted Zn finger-like uncharacterized protein
LLRRGNQTDFIRHITLRFRGDVCIFTHEGCREMIIQCQGCAAKYFLPEDKVPENPLKVRCPKCTAVFTLVPQLAPVGVGAPAHTAPAAAGPVPSAPPVVEHTLEAAPVPAPPVAEPMAPAASAAPPVAEPAPPVAEPAPPVAEPAPPATEPTPPAAEPAEPAKPAKSAKSAKSKRGGRSKDDRAKRLARVLVSDILCYNQDKRDQALQDGTLMTVLGEEITKSWELYKEKVGPDLANSTNYFKEALNEILADGQEVF